MKSQSVPPYCKGETPQILPLLSMQVEMLYQLVVHIPVSTEEEVVPSMCQPFMHKGTTMPCHKALPMPVQHASHASTVPPQEVTPELLRPHMQTPQPLSSHTRTPQASLKGKEKMVNFPDESNDSNDNQRNLQSPSPSEVSTLSELSMMGSLSKIPKPQGEVGRPGRGGYMLEVKLSWDVNELK